MLTQQNNLFPIFLKTEALNILIVGGGAVAAEKLHFLLKSSPDAKPKLVASQISEAVLNSEFKQLFYWEERPFSELDLLGIDVIIIAVNDLSVASEIRALAKAAGVLVNVADKPELCDFYLGGIVTKGDLKIAISTNGNSPVFAKRFRALLEDALPESIPEIITNLHQIRKYLKTTFKNTAAHLLEITREFKYSDKALD